MEKKVSHKEKVQESARSKALSNLETSEELQKDIQRMYSEAKKIVDKNSDSPKAFIYKNVLYSMEKPLKEVKGDNIDKMKTFQVEKFWNDAYTHLDRVKLLNSQEK